MIAQIVRFKSGLSEEEICKRYEERAPRYRQVKGLIQKYYMWFPETGEYGAVYLWDSEAAIEEFRESDLGRTIATTYEVQGAPDVLKGEVVLTLHPEG